MSGADRGQDLAALQRWLQQASTHPSGLAAGIALAQSSVGLDDEQLEDVVASGYGISPIERLCIYHRGYFARLLQCLRAEYAVLAGSLSSDWFDSMGRRYLAHCPSNSWTLTDLGSGFPDFLESDRPDTAATPHARIPAFDFIVELARLERTFVEISRGPGTEAAEPAIFDGLEQRDPASIRLIISPALRLFRTTFALKKYFEAARQGEVVSLPEPRRQCIAMCRFDFRVRLYEVSAWQFDLLVGLTAGGSLAAALADTSRRHVDAPVRADWPHCLSLYAARGFFSAIEIR